MADTNRNALLTKARAALAPIIDAKVRCRFCGTVIDADTAVVLEHAVTEHSESVRLPSKVL